jgi:hypothetical protein
MAFSEGKQPFTGNSMATTSIHRRWFSYRGLSPHKFMPMPGVHKASHNRPFGAGPPHCVLRPVLAALELKKFVPCTVLAKIGHGQRYRVNCVQWTLVVGRSGPVSMTNSHFIAKGAFGKGKRGQIYF